MTAEQAQAHAEESPVDAGAGRAFIVIPEEEVEAATAGDTSPVGAGLLYLRRMRAARARNATAEDRRPRAPVAVAEAGGTAADGLGFSQAALDALCINRPEAGDAQGEVPGGLSQAELDELCQPGEAEEQPASGPGETLVRLKRARAFGSPTAAEQLAQELWARGAAELVDGLTQAELDASAVVAENDEPASPAEGPEEQLWRIKRARAFAAAPEPLSQAQLDAMCIDGNDEDASPVGAGGSLRTLKRLHAFAGAEEAAAFRAQAFPQVAAAGLSQAELDELVGPAEAAEGDEEDAEAEGSGALCVRLRRARAFAGAGEAERLAEEALNEAADAVEPLPAVPKVTVQLAEPAPAGQKVIELPISKRDASPRLLGRERSPSQSRDPKLDLEEQEPTSGRARSKLTVLLPSAAGKSPVGGFLSPSFARSPRIRGGA